MNVEKFREALRNIEGNDASLAAELRRRLESLSNEVAFVAEGAENKVQLSPETIVLRTGRPVLPIRKNAVAIEIEEIESEVWRDRLTKAAPRLDMPIRGVGRIEVDGHPNYTWLGTGWLVRPDIVVTNRHVASEFARRSGQGFQFRIGVGRRPMRADVDFLEEIGNGESLTFKLNKVLHMEDEDGPDLAFLLVAGTGVPKPIALRENGVRPQDLVAAIGYPARDSRVPEQDLMDRIFGNVYEKKRFAPGQVMDAADDLLRHDCSTLGGNSGSVLVDLSTGEAIGVHFAGRFLEANYAVPSARLAERLHEVEHGRGVKPSGSQSVEDRSPQAKGSDGTSLSFTIPLQVTVRLGDAVLSAGDAAKAAQGSASLSGEEAEVLIEGRPEDYEDRRGYQSRFLGHDISVELPEVVRGREDILRFTYNGDPLETELRYHNFSVVMNKARRLCFFSAVNIDGNQPRKTRRPRWQLDPRIPKEYHIIGECYGAPPKFSRGHMTRREDPAWGSQEEAYRGNADSMHVTNAVPQMQTFNGGIWLELEDYALQHAREDDMKICVITGPMLRANDPVRYGVKIPVQFWKVIAFIHDETGELSATGYTISQSKFLVEDEFVFGAYQTYQRSLSSIEQMAGVSFGGLSRHDRFGEREAMGARPLMHPGEIRWH